MLKLSSVMVWRLDLKVTFTDLSKHRPRMVLQSKNSQALSGKDIGYETVSHPSIDIYRIQHKVLVAELQYRVKSNKDPEKGG